jgi:hypothetical protein
LNSILDFTFSVKLIGWSQSVQRQPTNYPVMNKNHIINCLLILAGFLAPVQLLRAQAPTPAMVSAEKTSFTEVTSQLDPGGNFYLYLSTAQWLEHLSTKSESWRQKFEAMPDIKPEDRTNMDRGFDLLNSLIKDSGLEDVSGFGMSSIEIEKGLYRNKALMYHYPGKDKGFLWKMGGGQPHALTGLDFLPANTAFAIFMDADLPYLWSVTQQEVAQSKFPAAQAFLAKLPAQFEQATQLKWDQAINSLGGEFGLALTLDASNQVPIPLPSGFINIPEPGLLFVIKINDDTLFNRIDTELKKNKQVISSEDNGLKMRTMPIPIPMALNLRPTVATGGGYLFIGSSDAIVHEALAVKNGQKPGLKSTEEFKRLAQGLPDQGNQFSYISDLFGKTVLQIQQQMMNAPGASRQNPAQAQWMQSLFNSRPTHGYSVAMNTDTGYLAIGNSSQSEANMVLLPAVAVPGMMAAIAIPNFVKARATSQRNACINNLRMIEAAKQQWALEKGKKDGDVPTQDDLMPYLSGHWPVCPQGGTYTIGAVGEPPTCSIPDHKLP